MGSISLREGLKIHGPMSESDVKTLGLKIANCLLEIHREGKVLGTVSPDLVFITDAGQVKIGNTAQELRGPSLREYVSPEMLVGKRAQPLSDIYQLGLLLMESSVGLPPFSWLDESRRAAAISSEPPYKQKLPLSREFIRLLTSSTARNLDERPQTAGEFVEKLRSLGDEGDFDSTFSTWLEHSLDSSERPFLAGNIGSQDSVECSQEPSESPSYWRWLIFLITIAIGVSGIFSYLQQENRDLITDLSMKVKKDAVAIKWTSPEELSRIQWKLLVKGQVIKTGTSLASSFSTHSLSFSHLQSGQVHVVILSNKGNELGKLAFTPGIEVQ